MATHRYVQRLGILNDALRFGALGVDMFFLLSSFLITWLLVGEHGRSGAISFRKFYARRACARCGQPFSFHSSAQFYDWRFALAVSTSRTSTRSPNT